MAAPMQTQSSRKKNVPDSEVLRIIEQDESTERTSDLDQQTDGDQIRDPSDFDHSSDPADDSDRDPNYVPINPKRGRTSDSSIQDEQNTDSSDGEPVMKGKKKVRNPKNWIRNVRKKKRNAGEAYTSIAGKAVAAKAFQPIQQHNCKYKCKENITEDECRGIFNKFWATGDFDQQNAFVCGSIRVTRTKRQRDRTDEAASRRSFSRKYTMTTPRGDATVCKTFYLKTLGISNGRLNRALGKQVTEGQGVPIPDKRGNHGKQRKLDPDSLQGVKDHITSFPAYDSHYTRAHQRTRKYLSPELNVAKMYQLYVEECEKKGVEPLKEWVYRHTFTTKFNLSFHPPRKDTCKTCDILKVRLDAASDETEKATHKAELELHHRKAEKIRESLSAESEKTKDDPTYDAITFDLEKTLPTPYLSTGMVYYKRQLWTYNLGIHSMRDNSAKMYMWHEATAKRGANDIGSCVYKYVKEQSEQGVKKITAYSDSCGGQNRNIKMALFWSHIVATLPIVEVNHKFMVSGHSYLPNDQDFGVIEKKKSGAMCIYVPDDWMDFVSKARKHKKFEVVKMQQKDFLNSDAMAEITVNRKKCSDGADVKWLKIQWICFKKESPLKMYLKYSADEDAPFYELDLQRRVKARRGRPLDPKVVTLPQLYNEPIAINPLKLKDLKELLQLVPPIKHQFYNDLMESEEGPVYHQDDISDFEDPDESDTD